MTYWQAMTTGYHILVLLVLVVTTPTQLTGFLLSNSQCVAPSTCRCSEYLISCNNKSLKVMPIIGFTNDTNIQHSFTIDLGHNQIMSIPNQSFKNVSFVNASYLEIILRNNKISTFSSGAFEGIENMDIYLFLQDNNIFVLPNAFEKLNRLEQLYLTGNPLIALDSLVMAHIGRSLNRLEFEMGHFKSWPNGFNKLNVLQTLEIFNIPFKFLPIDAFDGMAKLSVLRITYSKLERIPAAICHIRNLSFFSFEHNSAIDTNHTQFQPCSNPLMSVTRLILVGNSFHNFPDILSSFPSVRSLYIADNSIRFIHSDVIPHEHGLEKLHFERNSLTHIPFALNKLTNMTYLNMGSNGITTVEDNDLIGLSKLVQLILSDNPVEYIAPDAFKHNVEILQLGIDSTKLHQIPKAVILVPRLESLFFDNNNAECSCRLSYLKNWNATDVYLRGNCLNQPGDTIKQYIVRYLQQCP